MRAGAPIFIIGTERSGSNLLRLILNAHPEIAAPHPPHFMAYFGRLEELYGDLDVSTNFERLIEDLLAHLRGHIHPWAHVPSKRDVLRLVRSRDVFSASYAFYEWYAAKSGKRTWACKSTFMIDHCDRILAHYPDAKLVWLVRDPRDVALSSKTSVFNPYHPYYTARLWRRQQEVGLGLEARLPATVLRRLRYEDLIGDPASAVAELCRFVGVPFDPAMLSYADTPDARVASTLSRDWRNTSRPVLSANAGKFASRLPPGEIAVVESEAAPAMRMLGYGTVSAELRPAAPSAWRRPSFWLKDEALRAKAECLSLVRDRNGWSRWRRASRMAWLSFRLRAFGGPPGRRRPSAQGRGGSG